MSQPSAIEQYLLELLNADRAKAGAQPLAFNSHLNDAAGRHSDWMAATDNFSHAGEGGSNPGQRMVAAGYKAMQAWGENIAGRHISLPSGYQDEVDRLHSQFWNSPTHKSIMLNGNYREVGIGLTFDGFAWVTEDFAKSNNTFLTGIVYDDKDGDRLYDVGEGLGGIDITAKAEDGSVYRTETWASGGYSLALDPGTYQVTFSDGIEPVSHRVAINSHNVRIALRDPSEPRVVEGPGEGGGADGGAASPPSNPLPVNTPPSGGEPSPAPAPQPAPAPAPSQVIAGTNGNDTLFGTNKADSLVGHGGNDLLLGGLGDDRLDGKAGSDILIGGPGKDVFAFSSIVGGYDTVYFERGQDRLDFSDLFASKGGGFNADMALDGGFLTADATPFGTTLTVDLDGAAGHDHDATLAAYLMGISPSALGSGDIIV